MKSGNRAFAVSAALSMALLFFGASHATSLQARIDGRRVGGLWILNEHESQLMPEPPTEEAQPHRGDGRQPDGHGGGMGGFGGFGGRSGKRPDESLMAQRRSLMALHRQPTARFTFVFRQDEDTIGLTDADGHVRTLLTVCKKYREPLPDGGAADRVTKWKDGVLVSELRGNGIKLVQCFQLDESGDKLVVTSTLEMSGRDERTKALRRVYDRGDAGDLD